MKPASILYRIKLFLLSAIRYALRCFTVKTEFFYELKCLQKRAFYSSEHIIKDIHKLGLKGKTVSWADLTLYYASFKETIILVNLLYSDSDTPTEYHVSIRRTGHNLLENRFNLNDYVEELKKRLLTAK